MFSNVYACYGTTITNHLYDDKVTDYLYTAHANAWNVSQQHWQGVHVIKSCWTDSQLQASETLSHRCDCRVLWCALCGFCNQNDYFLPNARSGTIHRVEILLWLWHCIMHLSVLYGAWWGAGGELTHPNGTSPYIWDTILHTTPLFPCCGQNVIGRYGCDNPD